MANHSALFEQFQEFLTWKHKQAANSEHKFSPESQQSVPDDQKFAEESPADSESAMSDTSTSSTSEQIPSHSSKPKEGSSKISKPEEDLSHQYTAEEYRPHVKPEGFSASVKQCTMQLLYLLHTGIQHVLKQAAREAKAWGGRYHEKTLCCTAQAYS